MSQYLINMRNLILIALVAMGMSFQGEVCATTANAQFQTSIQESSPVDDATLEAVFNNVAAHSNFSVEELWSGYGQGTIQVAQINFTQYAVTISDLSEGIIDIVISDNL